MLNFELLSEFNLTEKQKSKLNTFYELVINYNKLFNLTAIVEEEDFLIKHFYDSLSITKFIKVDNDENIMDLGTGAGFPGICLAIFYPNANFYLVETTKKKIKFLEVVIDELSLNNVTLLNYRAELLPTKYKEFFDKVLSRAVSELRILSELSIPYLKVDGKLYSYKGIKYLEEIKNSESTLKVLNSEIKNIFSYKLPLLNIMHYIIEINKYKNCDIKYPRSYAKILKETI